MAWRTSGSSACGESSKRTLPDSIFSMSSMSLIRRTSRSQLLAAMSSRPRALAGISPAAPPSSSPSEPRTDVSGVRNSCETVAMNSFFIVSTFLRSETSRTTVVYPPPAVPRMRVMTISAGNASPSARRHCTSRRTWAATPRGWPASSVMKAMTCGLDAGATRSMTGVPTSAAVERWNICAAAGLMVSTWPAALSVTTPSPALSRMACSRSSFSRATPVACSSV
jgi:hypothetical protein